MDLRGALDGLRASGDDEVRRGRSVNLIFLLYPYPRPSDWQVASGVGCAIIVHLANAYAVYCVYFIYIGCG